MELSELQAIVASLRIIEDPRRDLGKKHQLVDLLVISLLSTICGGEDWTDMEDFGESHLDFLQSFLELPNGIPSHDTFRRVFSIIKPKELEKCLAILLDKIGKGISAGEVIAIDGKSLRGSLSKTKGVSCLHLVNAWAAERSILLGQVAVKDKSNEIVAIPELLDSLSIAGAVITIDAIGCQKDIAAKVRENKADYIFGLKANHPTLHRQVIDKFKALHSGDVLKSVVFETVEKEHGRIETRRCYSIPASDLSRATEWADLNSVTLVERVREVNGKVSEEKHFYISSLQPDSKSIATKIREHWKIENTLHWTLDVIFGEDSSSLRDYTGAQNLSLLRKIAISLIKQEGTQKMSIKRKRKKAGWDTKFLLKIIHSASEHTKPQIDLNDA